nr:MAG TPA: hypothetical protein [Microviridae sp.]
MYICLQLEVTTVINFLKLTIKTYNYAKIYYFSQRKSHWS